jgi:hypothetical protein
MPERRYWFRRKRIGWGLEPGTREGWIATCVFVIIDTGGSFALLPFLARTHPRLLVAWAVGWLVLFIGFVIFKGEPLWKQQQP